MINNIRYTKVHRVPRVVKKQSISAEDYLERIHELITEKGYARAVDIANALGISQSSVTSMVQKLAQEGLLNYEKYRGLTLTKEGLRVALAIHERHEILKRFLSLLNVSQQAQMTSPSKLCTLNPRSSRNDVCNCPTALCHAL